MKVRGFWTEPVEGGESIPYITSITMKLKFNRFMKNLRRIKIRINEL